MKIFQLSFKGLRGLGLCALLFLAGACSKESARWQWGHAQHSVNWVAAGDANGDGHSDLLVGLAGAGGASCFMGGPKGLASEAAWQFKGGDLAALTGFCVGFAGDMDGDGHEEVYVTAPRDRQIGSVYLFRGGKDGPEKEAWRVLRGDQRGQGYGEQASAVGDLNGDGFADLAIGDFTYGEHRGRLCVYYGSKLGPGPEPGWVGLGESPGDWYGYSLGQSVDLDQDGYDDLVVGAKNCSGACLRWLAEDPRFSLHRDYLLKQDPSVQGTSAQAGKLYVYWGSRKGLGPKPSLVQEGELPHSLFAFKVQAFGKGIVVSTPGWMGKRGKLEHFTSDSSRRLIKQWEAEGEVPGKEQGYLLGAPGDLDGDGSIDLVSGTREGVLAIYRGTSQGLSQRPAASAVDWIWTGPLVGGDFDGDGKNELGAAAYPRPAVQGSRASAYALDLF